MDTVTSSGTIVALLTVYILILYFLLMMILNLMIFFDKIVYALLWFICIKLPYGNHQWSGSLRGSPSGSYENTPVA